MIFDMHDKVHPTNDPQETRIISEPVQNGHRTKKLVLPIQIRIYKNKHTHQDSPERCTTSLLETLSLLQFLFYVLDEESINPMPVLVVVVL
jgi:hypothetical protein